MRALIFAFSLNAGSAAANAALWIAEAHALSIFFAGISSGVALMLGVAIAAEVTA